MIFHDINQNTEEWLELRAPRITGSSLSSAMANFGKAFGDPAKKYAVSIALAQITPGYRCPGFKNDDMDRGHIEEPLARMAYEEEYFCDISNGGFFECNDVGCSPDGLVNDDGLIEIKSAIPSIHYARIVKQSFDSGYKWQLIGNMKITGRKWIDFISYCSSFPADKKLYVYRLHSSNYEKEYSMIDERLEEFRALIKTTKENIINGNYSII